MKVFAALLALISSASAQLLEVGYGPAMYYDPMPVMGPPVISPPVIGPPVLGPPYTAPVMGPPIYGPPVPVMGPPVMPPAVVVPQPVYGGPVMATPMMGGMALLYDENDDPQAAPVLRRMNSNTQSGIQQYGNGNTNLQGNIQQVNRRYQQNPNQFNDGPAMLDDVQRRILTQKFTEGYVGQNDEVAY